MAPKKKKSWHQRFIYNSLTRDILIITLGVMYAWIYLNNHFYLSFVTDAFGKASTFFVITTVSKVVSMRYHREEWSFSYDLIVRYSLLWILISSTIALTLGAFEGGLLGQIGYFLLNQPLSNLEPFYRIGIKTLLVALSALAWGYVVEIAVYRHAKLIMGIVLEYAFVFLKQASIEIYRLISNLVLLILQMVKPKSKPVEVMKEDIEPIATEILDTEPEEAIAENNNSPAKVSKTYYPSALETKSFMIDGSEFELPSVDFLETLKVNKVKHFSDSELQQKAIQLENVLENFKISGKIVNIHSGPVVNLFELEPSPGVKISRVIALADDIARNMSVNSARVYNMYGTTHIGIELPNLERESVFFKQLITDLLNDHAYKKKQREYKLVVALGKDILGKLYTVDLVKMPHLLVAGTTGSGKSVAVNTMILSLLYQYTPVECKFVMIDPKMLELSVYNDIPHLLTPVVTDSKKAVVALKWAVKEMEDRYRKMTRLGVRNLEGYNQRISEAIANNEVLEKKISVGMDSVTGEMLYETEVIENKLLPLIVIIVDEMADLMLVAGKEIEASIQRLSQMARAAGIHLIMATQRPSVDVITGVIKSNFPSRIAFRVSSKIDGRTILDQQGAEQLLGMGDMLLKEGGGKVIRLHGGFVTERDIEKVVSFLKLQGKPEYVDEILFDPEEIEAYNASEVLNNDDALLNKALEIFRKDQKISISYLQRRLQIGYNKAAKIVEDMEAKEWVSKPDITGKRKLLV